MEGRAESGRMSARKPRVAVVFSSFNRKEVALECVDCLRAQTRRPEMVVIGDNASEDGSAKALRETGWEAVEVIDTGGNHGNAGAVQRAMDHAFERGADAVWILDDDSWPREDALERLLEGGWDPRVVRHPLQIDPETDELTWPLQLVTEQGVVLCRSVEDLPDGQFHPSRGVWTGALIPRGVWDVVGPVNEDLFIRGEDEEYPWRVEMAGFGEELVVKSVLDHPGPRDLIEWSFLGRRLFWERGLPTWKLYYKMRNMVWLRKQQVGFLGALLMALAYGVAMVRIEGLTRLPSWWSACSDGWSGKLGRKDFG